MESSNFMDIRRELGYTQEQLAQRLGCALSVIRAAEKGRNTRGVPGPLATCMRLLTQIKDMQKRLDKAGSAKVRSLLDEIEILRGDKEDLQNTVVKLASSVKRLKARVKELESQEQ